MIRLVLDTNVVASAMLWGGSPKLLLQAGRENRAKLFTGVALLTELEDVLARPKFASKIAAATLTPDLIGTALAARADCLVTGDGALLSVGAYETVRITGVADTLAMIAHPEP